MSFFNPGNNTFTNIFPNDFTNKNSSWVNPGVNPGNNVTGGRTGLDTIGGNNELLYGKTGSQVFGAGDNIHYGGSSVKSRTGVATPLSEALNVGGGFDDPGSSLINARSKAYDPGIKSSMALNPDAGIDYRMGQDTSVGSLGFKPNISQGFIPKSDNTMDSPLATYNNPIDDFQPNIKSSIVPGQDTNVTSPLAQLQLTDMTQGANGLFPGPDTNVASPFAGMKLTDLTQGGPSPVVPDLRQNTNGGLKKLTHLSPHMNTGMVDQAGIYGLRTDLSSHLPQVDDYDRVMNPNQIQGLLDDNTGTAIINDKVNQLAGVSGEDEVFEGLSPEAGAISPLSKIANPDAAIDARMNIGEAGTISPLSKIVNPDAGIDRRINIGEAASGGLPPLEIFNEFESRIPEIGGIGSPIGSDATDGFGPFPRTMVTGQADTGLIEDPTGGLLDPHRGGLPVLNQGSNPVQNYTDWQTDMARIMNPYGLMQNPGAPTGDEMDLALGKLGIDATTGWQQAEGEAGIDPTAQIATSTFGGSPQLDMPTITDYTETMQNPLYESVLSAMGQANPYDTRRDEILVGQEKALDQEYNEARENLRHEFESQGLEGTPLYRDRLKSLEEDRIRAELGIRSDFGLQAAQADEQIRRNRIGDLAGALSGERQRVTDEINQQRQIQDAANKQYMDYVSNYADLYQRPDVFMDQGLSLMTDPTSSQMQPSAEWMNAAQRGLSGAGAGAQAGKTDTSALFSGLFGDQGILSQRFQDLGYE